MQQTIERMHQENMDFRRQSADRDQQQQERREGTAQTSDHSVYGDNFVP